MQKFFLKFILISVFALTSACSNFKFPWAYSVLISQGNIIDKEMFEKLEKGMTRKQVRFILGSPLLEDTFNPNRWDYYYSLRKEEKDLYDYHLYVIFEDDKLVRWQGNIDALKSEKEEREGDKVPETTPTEKDSKESDNKEEPKDSDNLQA